MAFLRQCLEEVRRRTEQPDGLEVAFAASNGCESAAGVERVVAPRRLREGRETAMSTSTRPATLATGIGGIGT